MLSKLFSRPKRDKQEILDPFENKKYLGTGWITDRLWVNRDIYTSSVVFEIWLSKHKRGSEELLDSEPNDYWVLYRWAATAKIYSILEEAQDTTGWIREGAWMQEIDSIIRAKKQGDIKAKEARRVREEEKRQVDEEEFRIVVAEVYPEK